MSIEIIVNAVKYNWQQETIDYDQLVILAHPNAKNRQGYTIVYSGKRVGDIHRSGTLIPGENVRPDNGMVFDVHRCDNA